MDQARQTMNRQGGAIAMLLCLMLGFCLWALVFREVPEANQNALLVVIGILSGALGQVINFYFGSTSSSKQQQGIIDKQADAIKTAQASPAAPLPENTVNLEAGETATVRADP